MVYLMTSSTNTQSWCREEDGSSFSCAAHDVTRRGNTRRYRLCDHPIVSRPMCNDRCKFDFVTHLHPKNSSGDGMILQRNAASKVWGIGAAPGSTVTLTLAPAPCTAIDHSEVSFVRMLIPQYGLSYSIRCVVGNASWTERDL